jgi:hypothetical protein
MDTTYEAIGPNRNTRDGRKGAPRRSHRFGRGSALGSRVARRIAAAASIGLTALSVVLAAPASAHGSHDGGEVRHQNTTISASQAQAPSAKSSTAPSSHTENAAADAPASNPSVDSTPQVRPGHDKCKAEKGPMPDPPWCTDPSAGWMQSTLNRTDASFPTLPGAEATADRGRAAAGRGAATMQAAIGQPRP